MGSGQSQRSHHPAHSTTADSPTARLTTDHLTPCSTKPASPPPSRAPPTAAPSGAPTSSCWAPAPRSATPAGPTRAAATTPATASSRSTTCTPSSPSSRSAAAACTASAGAIPPTGNPARPKDTPTALDQPIGTGDGTTAAFQLTKTYGSAFNPWTRDIKKPVAGTVLVAVAGVAADARHRLHRRPRHRPRLLPAPATSPPPAHAITAGFEFDVPVRFDTDKLEINLQGFRHGAIPSIPIVEIRV